MPSTATDRIDGLSTSVAIKAPCRVATTAEITLSGIQTIDGVVLAEGNRVLVKNQTDTTENGVYVVATTAWARAKDFDGARDVTTGTILLVTSGTTNTNTYWRMTTTGTVQFGVSAITFASALASSATGVSYEPSGTGAVTRSVAQVLAQHVNVLDFGTNNDGTGDATTGIQAALDAVTPIITSKGYTVHIPDGLYFLDGMVTVQQYKAIVASPGARFIRKSSRSSSQLPLFYGRGNYWDIDLGGAWVTTEVDSPTGVICLGQKDVSTEELSSQYWRFRNARVFAKDRGIPSSPAYTEGTGVGLYIASSQPFYGSTASNYFGLVENVDIKSATEGVLMTDIANGHKLSNIRVDYFYHRAFKLTGAYGNTIEGCFVNGCAENNKIVIEIATKAAPGATYAAGHESDRNVFTGVTMELYWTTGVGVDIDALCQNNFFQFEYASTGSASVLRDLNNCIFEGNRSYIQQPRFPVIPEYADEAAAAAGLLEAGAVYRTAAGALRVKL